MKIEFLQDPRAEETLIRVIAAERSESVERLLADLEATYTDLVKGYDEERVVLLRPSDILRIYAEDARVWCQTEDGTYLVRSRLYEMEKRLDAQTFVRISKCELVNVHHIRHLDVSLSGTVGILLDGNVRTYTSRRYMKAIKAVFGL